jgi:hypothetical protein
VINNINNAEKRRLLIGYNSAASFYKEACAGPHHRLLSERAQEMWVRRER